MMPWFGPELRRVVQQALDRPVSSAEPLSESMRELAEHVIRIREQHPEDCPKCQVGLHRECLEDPDVGATCGCAEGGHA